MPTPSKRSSTPSKSVTSESSSLASQAVRPAPIDISDQPVRSRIPTNVPSIYADQIVDVVYGAHTTKLVFGIENGSGVQAVGVAVIPTGALLASVLAIKENLTAPGMVEEMTSRLSGVLRMMRQEPQSKSMDSPAKKKR